MHSEIPGQATARMRESWYSEDRPKGYTGTRELVDDRSGEVLARCDVSGRVVFAALEIDGGGGVWRMQPNRKVLPTRWLVTDPQQRLVMQLDQKLLGKLTNPLYRVVLALLDAAGNERFRLVDPRASLPDLVLGVGPDELALMDGDRVAATLVRLPRPQASGSGLLGKVRRFMAGSERGIRSASDTYPLPPPLLLGMMLLVKELMDTSGG